MPLSCDCYPGCWGVHSQNWPSILVPEGLTAQAVGELGIPYGSYVFGHNNLLFIETPELMAKLRDSLSKPFALKLRARPEDLTIHEAQRNQSWTGPYSREVNNAKPFIPHILASHTALHAAKTVGKLAAVFESLDHTDAPITDEQLQVVKGASADLMSEALRFANLYNFDLATELLRRQEEKNK